MLQRPDKSWSAFLTGHSVNLFPFIRGFWMSFTSWSGPGTTMASLSNSESSASVGVVTEESSLSKGFMVLLILTLIST